MNPATTEPACPVCGAVEHDVLMVSVNDCAILRCSACRLVFTDARGAAPPEKLYPTFDQSETAVMKNVRAPLSLFLAGRANVVLGLKRSGRLLDFGCGSGAFARYMSRRGFDVTGLEPFSLGSPQSTPNLTLLKEPLESAAPRLGSFDVITAWHVLEHVSKPVELLAALRSHLKSDGVLIVSVPNFGSFQSKVFKGSWFHLDPPRHLVHFERDTLQATLARAGFSPVSEVRFLPEYGSSGWVQSALNRVLPHSNFLYEYVKDRGALAGLSRTSVGTHLVASVAGAVPVLAASFPVEAVASSFGAGAALTIAARARTPSQEASASTAVSAL